MASYKRYISKKDGKAYYGLTAYLGTDPITGKHIRVHRRRDENGQPFKTKKQARDEVARLEAAFTQGIIHKPTRKELRTFEDVADEWLEKRYKKEVLDSTYMATRYMFFDLHILPRLGAYKLDRISRDVMRELVEEWADTFSRHRFKVIVNYTAKVLDYAIEQDALAVSPLNGVHIPTIKKSPPKRTAQFYNRHELTAFLTACDAYGEPWGTLFHFLAYTGLRMGEALSLTWDDIDFRGQHVFVNKTLAVRMGANGVRELITHHGTKNGSGRLVSLDDVTMAKLGAFRSSTLTGPVLVFPAVKSKTKDKPMFTQSASNAMRTIIKRYNLKAINAHELRHTHCSLLFEAGVNMNEVQKRLGHKDITVTMNVYAHVSRSRADEVADTFKDYVSQTKKQQKKAYSGED